jgi:hypothetical protein
LFIYGYRVCDLAFVTSQAKGTAFVRLEAKRSGESVIASWRMNENVLLKRILSARKFFRLNFKPLCISQYNMFMKGVDRADQYLAYSLIRKTVKWTKKVALWLINCAPFNSFLVYKNLNPGSKVKYEEFLVQVAKAWATDEIQAAQTGSVQP